VLYNLRFNGYRLDHRASRFDAVHANYKSSIVAGYYKLSSPGTASVTQAFPASNRPQTSRLGTEYELRPVHSWNMTPVRHCLLDGNSLLRTGIQVNSTFFYAARSIAGGKPLDGLVLCVQYSAPWMRTALAEVGTREVPGAAANAQILAYFNAANFTTTDDTGEQNAWCASFVTWVMKQNGYTPPRNPFRALAWENFGKKINAPVYGALGIKPRATGGGHISFVVGKSTDGNSLFMLGGNQDNRVSIARYDRNVWTSFVAPEKFDNSVESLPVYTQPAEISGSEA
jgi:uncharacterized protein (TIGR02594 family)